MCIAICNFVPFSLGTVKSFLLKYLQGYTQQYQIQCFFQSVLALEAGTSAPPIHVVPGFAASLFDTKHDYAYRTVPSNGHYCLGMKHNSCAWHAGKAIGGTTVMNGMLYVRGAREDFDEWERLGNRGRLTFFLFLKRHFHIHIF